MKILDCSCGAVPKVVENGTDRFTEIRCHNSDCAMCSFGGPSPDKAAEVWNREVLIRLCELAIVPRDKWRHRNTDDRIAQVGNLWAYLKAGCQFNLMECPQDEGWTYYVEVYSSNDVWVSMVPAPARLAAAAGGDWFLAEKPKAEIMP